jgi:anaerobic selenocysteine-containing dehydrogenase
MKTEVKSTCCYCGVGCGVLIETEGERIIGVRGDPDHPANRGRLCTKGNAPSSRQFALSPPLSGATGVARAARPAR